MTVWLKPLFASARARALVSARRLCLERRIGKFKKPTADKRIMTSQQDGSAQVPNVGPSVPVEPDVDLSALPPVPDSPGDHTTDQRSDYSHKRCSAAAVDTSTPAVATLHRSKGEGKRGGASEGAKKHRSRSRSDGAATRDDRKTSQEQFQSNQLQLMRRQ